MLGFGKGKPPVVVTGGATKGAGRNWGNSSGN